MIRPTQKPANNDKMLYSVYKRIYLRRKSIFVTQNFVNANNVYIDYEVSN